MSASRTVLVVGIHRIFDPSPANLAVPIQFVAQSLQTIESLLLTKTFEECLRGQFWTVLQMADRSYYSGFSRISFGVAQHPYHRLFEATLSKKSA